MLFARCIFPPFLSCYKDNIVVVAPAFLSSFSFPAPRFQRPPIAFPLFSSSIRARPTRFKATRLISNEKTVYERDIGLSSLFLLSFLTYSIARDARGMCTQKRVKGNSNTDFELEILQLGRRKKLTRLKEIF